MLDTVYVYQEGVKICLFTYDMIRVVDHCIHEIVNSEFLTRKALMDYVIIEDMKDENAPLDQKDIGDLTEVDD